MVAAVLTRPTDEGYIGVWLVVEVIETPDVIAQVVPDQVQAGMTVQVAEVVRAEQIVVETAQAVPLHVQKVE